MNGQMSSMRYSSKDIERLLKLDPAGILVKKLREVDATAAIDGDNASCEKVKLIAKEVLKACNVIRPAISNLASMP